MNRGFSYGDGFFETIRLVDGTAPLLLFHLDRIADGLQIYGFEPEFVIDEDFLQAILKEYPDNGLVRINFFREGEGTYAPESNAVAFSHSFRETEHPFFLPIKLDLIDELKQAPVVNGTVGVYDKPKPMVDWLTVKSLSSAYYVLAASYARANSIDYLLIQNTRGDICEELSSNLLWVKGDQVFLTLPDSGAVNGATQRYIWSNYHTLIYDEAFDIEKMDDLDGVYLLRGSRGVIRIK